MSTVIDTLVFDRSQADVDRVFVLKDKIMSGGWSSLTSAEQTEYLAGMKGAYNYTDMNRVGSAVSYIANRMTTLQGQLDAYRATMGVADAPIYDVPYDPSDVVVSVVTSWTVSSTPTLSQITTYLNNLSVLRRQLTLPVNTPAVPVSLDGMTFEVANDIEQLLCIIDTTLTEVETTMYALIDNTVNAYVYAGEWCCS